MKRFLHKFWLVLRIQGNRFYQDFRWSSSAPNLIRQILQFLDTLPWHTFVRISMSQSRLLNYRFLPIPVNLRHSSSYNSGSGWWKHISSTSGRHFVLAACHSPAIQTSQFFTLHFHTLNRRWTSTDQRQCCWYGNCKLITASAWSHLLLFKKWPLRLKKIALLILAKNIVNLELESWKEVPNSADSIGPICSLAESLSFFHFFRFSCGFFQLIFELAQLFRCVDHLCS
jgi:hypothetical protein